MTPAANDLAALLALLPEGSPAIELIDVAVDNSDDPEEALRDVIATWAAGSDSEEGSA